MEAIIYYIIAGGVFLLSMIVRQKLELTYRRWGGTRSSANISGAQTAQAILDANRMERVRMGQTPGKLIARRASSCCIGAGQMYYSRYH